MRIRGEVPGAAWSAKLHLLTLTATKIRYFFDVLLTVHLSIILVINQFNEQIFKFIGPSIILIVE